MSNQEMKTKQQPNDWKYLTEDANIVGMTLQCMWPNRKARMDIADFGKCTV